MTPPPLPDEFGSNTDSSKSDSDTDDADSEQLDREAVSRVKEQQRTSTDDTSSAGGAGTDTKTGGDGLPGSPLGSSGGGGGGGGGAPDDINQGRRTSTDTTTGDSSDTSGGQTGGPPPSEEVARSAGLSNVEGDPSVAQDLEEQAVADNEFVDNTSEVRVTDVETTDSGVRGSIELTGRGERNVQQRRAQQAEQERQQLRRVGEVIPQDIEDTRQQRQARERAQVEEDIAQSQFNQRQFERQLSASAPGVGRQDIAITPDPDGGISIDSTVGGQSRSLIDQATSQPGITRDDIELTTTQSGLGVQFTDQEFRERAASELENVSASDLRVTSEQEFQADAGLFAAADTSRPESTRRNVELTDDAARERLLENAREQYPNAESIEIVEEDGELAAEIETEGEVSRAVRIGGQFVDDPVGSTVEGSQDIVVGSGEALTQLGADTVEATTNPVRTLDTSSTDFVEGGTDITQDLITGVQRDAGTAADITGDVIVGGSQVAAGGRAQQPAGGIPDSGTAAAVSDYVADVGARSEAVATSAAVAPIAAPVTAGALAEPTPFGEIGVAGAAGVGALVIAGTVAAERGLDAVEEGAQNTVTEREGELPVGQPAQDVNELEPGEPTTGEIDVGSQRPTSEVGVGETVVRSEIDTPDEPATSTGGEVAVPAIETQQLAAGETRLEEDDETTDEEDDALGVPDDPFLESDRRLYDPSREFGEQESIVSETDATEPELGESADDIGSGIAGQGGSMFDEPDVPESELIGSSTTGMFGEQSESEELLGRAQRPRVRERSALFGRGGLLAGVVSPSVEVSDAELDLEETTQRNRRRERAEESSFDIDGMTDGVLDGDRGLAGLLDGVLDGDQTNVQTGDRVDDVLDTPSAFDQPSATEDATVQNTTVEETLDDIAVGEQPGVANPPGFEYPPEFGEPPQYDFPTEVSPGDTGGPGRRRPRPRPEFDFDDSDTTKRRDGSLFELQFTRAVGDPASLVLGSDFSDSDSDSGGGLL